ncbi:hypothetical protein SDC9_103317 [bioreactor metagenome]|uniref:Uncharacterized protein n=1 Tax=bioreactor metagenome TaxID=1076179 RepID=A0A645AW27_9ZZZZ
MYLIEFSLATRLVEYKGKVSIYFLSTILKDLLKLSFMSSMTSSMDLYLSAISMLVHFFTISVIL